MTLLSADKRKQAVRDVTVTCVYQKVYFQQFTFFNFILIEVELVFLCLI